MFIITWFVVFTLCLEHVSGLLYLTPVIRWQHLIKCSSNSPGLSGVKPSIEKLNKELEDLTALLSREETELSALKAEYGDEINRINSEFERMQQRESHSHNMATERATKDAIKDILPIIDTMFRAQQTVQLQSLMHSSAALRYYNKIQQDLQDLLLSLEVTVVPTIGEEFNLQTMDALASLPSHDFPPGIVCQEYQPGYSAFGSCIRPALVAVSCGPGPGCAP